MVLPFFFRGFFSFFETQKYAIFFQSHSVSALDLLLRYVRFIQELLVGVLGEHF